MCYKKLVHQPRYKEWTTDSLCSGCSHSVLTLWLLSTVKAIQFDLPNLPDGSTRLNSYWTLANQQFINQSLQLSEMGPDLTGHCSDILSPLFECKINKPISTETCWQFIFPHPTHTGVKYTLDLWFYSTNLLISGSWGNFDKSKQNLLATQK